MSSPDYILYLKIHDCGDEDTENLKKYYEDLSNKLSAKYGKDPLNFKTYDHDDSGLDLVSPTDDAIQESRFKLYDLKVSCALYQSVKISEGCNAEITNKLIPSPYYLYPRSSMSKTRFRLANSVGIIDSGYRGTIKAALDALPNKNSRGYWFHIEKGSRLVQICTPTLQPIKQLIIADTLDVTRRNEGGFGSTGM